MSGHAGVVVADQTDVDRLLHLNVRSMLARI
jgi:hypothetical protein